MRNNLYDALDYAGQVEAAAKSHRRETKRQKEHGKQIESISGKNQKIPNSGEFLGGFWKEDRLIAPAQMPDAEIMKFQSSLREVLFFIKYSKDPKNLDRILEANKTRFRDLERRAADVIEAVTNSSLKYEENEEAVDMCKAIQDMRKEARRLGNQDGRFEKAQEVAQNFYDLGVEIEKIAQGVGYSLETVKEWLGIEQQTRISK